MIPVIQFLQRTGRTRCGIKRQRDESHEEKRAREHDRRDRIGITVFPPVIRHSSDNRPLPSEISAANVDRDRPTRL